MRPSPSSIFLSVMATNTMVVYGMVTTIVNAVPGRAKLKFLPTALIVGIISIIGSTWFGLLNQFTTFLVTIGALFAPVFAIMIADYYIVKRGAYTADILKAREGRYWYLAGVNWAAVVVWAIGAVAAYVFTYTLPTPVGATIPAFVITFVLYLLVSLRRALLDAGGAEHEPRGCRAARPCRMRDLSHPIRSGMQVYPGDPEVDLSAALELERDGAAVTALHLGSHSGTHVDAPAHTVAGGRTMDAVDLDELVGDALVIRVPGLADRATIGVDELGDLPERVPAIVVIETGWAQHFGTAAGAAASRDRRRGGAPARRPRHARARRRHAESRPDGCRGHVGLPRARGRARRRRPHRREPHRPRRPARAGADRDLPAAPGRRRRAGAGVAFLSAEEAFALTDEHLRT